MGLPKIYRKRYMPNETVLLKDDEILRLDEDILVTKWNVLHPKTQFSHGVSCYFLKKGYKISKFLNENFSIGIEFQELRIPHCMHFHSLIWTHPKLNKKNLSL